MNKKIGDRTYRALKCLYLNAKNLQNEKVIGYLRESQPLAYAKEFCTIKLATARRSGHSSAIARFINDHNNQNWAVISYNQNMSEHNLERVRFDAMDPKSGKSNIIKVTKSYVNFADGKTIFTSFGSFDRDLRGINLDGIIVDCAYMLTKEKTKKLYQTAMPCMARKRYQFFIFVG